jgi:hypothetical protein
LFPDLTPVKVTTALGEQGCQPSFKGFKIWYISAPIVEMIYSLQKCFQVLVVGIPLVDFE